LLPDVVRYGGLMHAITIREPGGPEVLEWTEVNDPTPGYGEVIIDVAASAVNRADLLQRQGFYPPPPGASAPIGTPHSPRTRSNHGIPSSLLAAPSTLAAWIFSHSGSVWGRMQL
jgi:hypothetical protein